MKKKLIPVILAAIISLFATFVFAGEFKITRVSDGDSIEAEGHDIEIKVRLVGIDAPETSKKKRDPGQPFSQKAKEYLANLILNKTVDLKGYGLGPFNRPLVVVYFDGKNINLEMVRAGLAEVYRGIAPHKFNLLPYWQAEKEARDDMMGIWSLEDKYVSPKVWRKIHKSNR